MENITAEPTEPISEPIIEPLEVVEPVSEPVVEQVVKPVVEQVVEPEAEPHPVFEREKPLSILEPEELPKVIQNSDVLFKSDIKWANNIEYVEPNAFEIEMLHGTKKPKELLEEEEKEKEIVVEKTEEEIKKQKTKDLLLIFKVVSLDRLGRNPLTNTSTLQPQQLKEFLSMMNSLIEDYNKGLEIAITAEFNKICTEKLFTNNTDVSVYPVYA